MSEHPDFTARVNAPTLECVVCADTFVVEPDEVEVFCVDGFDVTTYPNLCPDCRSNEDE